MLGCFPDPYPDEILYSVCARYKQRMALSEKDALNNLFGARYEIYVDQPLRLPYLVKELPPGNRYSVTRFIHENTLIPLYQAFFRQGYTEECKTVLKRNYPFLRSQRLREMTAPMLRRGVIQKTPAPSFLQFCPLCVKEDNDNYGEAYWHRVHQIPGIEICLNHNAFLQKSNVYLSITYVPSRLATVAEAVEVNSIKKL